MKTQESPQNRLASCRLRIDEIDDALLELFQERMRTASEVADCKRIMGKDIFDPVREQQRIDDMTESADPQFADAVAPLWLMLMELSRSHQHKLLNTGSDYPVPQFGPLSEFHTTACQGVEGAYSQQAARALLPHATLEFTDTWEEVCERVINGSVHSGILPLENSTAGSVDRVYDLLDKGNLYITGSIRLGIHHDLLAKPGTKISEIKEIYSHEQALRQSQHFIEGLGDDIHATILGNTAMAAKEVALSARTDVAAISSAACAELYSLETLARDVQDLEQNFTRFVCIARNPRITPDADRSSFLLVLPHQPGSLYRALARIAALGINMLKLESRPIPGSEFEFMFYVDIEGTMADEAVRALAMQLETMCERFVYLGSYAEVVA